MTKANTKSWKKALNCGTGNFNVKSSPFCGDAVHQDLITRERKDPKNPEVFVPICDNCNKAYLQKALIFPYCRKAEKDTEKAANKKAEYDTLCNGFSRVYGDIQNTNKRVLAGLTLDK